MLMAVIFYRQFKDLLSLRFLDELLFAGLAIAVPVVMMQGKSIPLGILSSTPVIFCRLSWSTVG